MGKNSQKQAPLNTPFGITTPSHSVPKSTPLVDFYPNYTNSDKHALDILKFIFDPTQWKQNFSTYQYVPQRRKIMRQMVQAGTIDACLRRSYLFLPDGSTVRLDKQLLERSATTTKMYQSDFNYSIGSQKGKNSQPAIKSLSNMRADSTSTSTTTTTTTTTTASNNNTTDNNNVNINNNTDTTDNTHDPGVTNNDANNEKINSTTTASASSTATSTASTATIDNSDSNANEGKPETTPTKHKIPKVPTEEDKVVIMEGDCIEVALWLKHKFNTNPLVLNMASMTHPGGGYRNGSGAQEESLHRRTNLFQCLEDPFQIDRKRSWSYPIPEFGGIYSRDVCVFRSSEEMGYAFKKSPDTLSFVAVAAYSNPPVETLSSGQTVLSKKIAQFTRRKIDTIFKIAIQNGHDCLVLGAFGCGAYCNPANHIARLFKEAIATYRHAFTIIAFAIIDAKTSTNPNGNLAAFAQELKLEPVKFSHLEPL